MPDGSGLCYSLFKTASSWEQKPGKDTPTSASKSAIDILTDDQDTDAGEKPVAAVAASASADVKPRRRSPTPPPQAANISSTSNHSRFLEPSFDLSVAVADFEAEQVELAPELESLVRNQSAQNTESTDSTATIDIKLMPHDNAKNEVLPPSRVFRIRMTDFFDKITRVII